MVIPASSLRLLVEGLAALGTPLEECADRIGVSSDALRGEGSTSGPKALALIDLALEVGGPAFGLEAGFAIAPGRMGLVDHLCGAAPTVDAALGDLARYFALVATGVSLRWDGEHLLTTLPAVDLAHRRLFGELTFALVEQRMTARSGAPLQARVSFPWAAPPHRERIEARWPEALFDAADCRMTLPRARVSAPLHTADPTLRDLLDGYASQELAGRGETRTVAQRAGAAIVAALPGRPPSADEVARALGMSARAMRRSLAAQGTRFSDVRDAALLSVAAGALADPERTVAEVGWLLGYSEPSAFHRAFRRWTNTTPELFRRSGQIGP